MQLVFIVIYIILSSIDIGLCVQNSNGKNVKKFNYYRLTTDVVPLDYLIEFTPYFNNEIGKEPFTFDGIVTITVNVTKANVKNITLHKDELRITEQTLTIKSGEYFSNFSLNIDRTEYNNVTNKFSIILSEPLVINQLYRLHLKFSGKLRTDMLGFYRSSYKDGNVTK